MEKKGVMSQEAFILWMGGAAMIDLLSIFIPLIGSIFIVCARITFSVSDYKGVSTPRMVLGVTVEAVPALSAIPSCLLYIGLFYAQNQALSEQEGEGESI